MHSPLRHLPSLFWKGRAIHLTFFVTRRCNARCPFCFYADARDAEAGAPELSLDEIRRVAASMGSLLWVLFSGGEPFLREDLAEISGIFHDASRAAFLTYPTNGLLPEVIVGRTEEILGRCPNSVVVVKLSLDGVGEAHDALRRVPGGFDRLMWACRGLAEVARRQPRLEVGINTLFCPENQGRMEEIVDFVRGLESVRSHTLTMLRDRPGEARCRDVDLERYREATRYLDERWTSGPSRRHRFAGAGLKAAQDRIQRRLIHRTLLQRRRLVPCHAGRLDLVLTEGGELHPCEGRWDLSFGNVRTAGCDVGRMLRSERAARILDEIARGQCHCSHECNALTNVLFNPMMQPRILGECLRPRLRWPAAPGAARERAPRAGLETDGGAIATAVDRRWWA